MCDNRPLICAKFSLKASHEITNKKVNPGVLGLVWRSIHGFNLIRVAQNISKPIKRKSRNPLQNQLCFPNSRPSFQFYTFTYLKSNTLTSKYTWYVISNSVEMNERKVIFVLFSSVGILVLFGLTHPRKKLSIGKV